MQYIVNENSDFLIHHGIKGQKWGERRFQNPDGTLTPEGKERYRKYVKEFGEQTANRLMKSLNKGYDEKTALKKEYNRRKYGSVGGARIPATVLSTLGGRAVGGIAGHAISEASGYDVQNLIANVMGGAAGATASLVTKHINDIKDGYSKYDVSKEGLKDFYYKAMKTLYN